MAKFYSAGEKAATEPASTPSLADIWSLASRSRGARREVMEETGMNISHVKFLFFENLVKYSGKHYADIGVMAQWQGGVPEVLEPDRCEGWGWYDLDKLPQPLFGTIENTIIAYKTGKNFFDSE